MSIIQFYNFNYNNLPTIQTMRKDFQQQVLDQVFRQNQKSDPYVYTTPQVQEIIKALSITNSLNFLFSYTISNVLLAPLQTIVTSLQLSVQKHKHIYQTQQMKTKQLARLTTQMTVHEKRKFQLMIRSGGKTIPYTAPVYEGYKQTFLGIKSQGLLAFYKGLPIRMITNFMYFFPLVISNSMIPAKQIEQGANIQILKTFAYCLALDVMANPLHTLQNRFILQNRIKQFRTIQKPFKHFMKMSEYGQSFRGVPYLFINNTVSLLTRFPVYFKLIGRQPLSISLYGLFLFGQLVSYPFSTVYKRLVCQTERFIGMIPTRYSGFWHCLKVMAYQEGARGLWRGFGLHSIQTILRLKIIEFFSTYSRKVQNI